MSEMQSGPGDWQASDGLWYPADTHPDPAYRTQHSSDTTHRPMAGYPARLSVTQSESVARWRFFVQWLMVIPHLLVAWLLAIASYVMAIVSWFVILFTGKMPQGIFDFQAMVQRYLHRVLGFSLFLTRSTHRSTSLRVHPTPPTTPSEPTTTTRARGETASPRSSASSWPSRTTSCSASSPT